MGLFTFLYFKIIGFKEVKGSMVPGKFVAVKPHETLESRILEPLTS